MKDNNFIIFSIVLEIFIFIILVRIFMELANFIGNQFRKRMGYIIRKGKNKKEERKS